MPANPTPDPPDDGPLLLTPAQAAVELAVSRDYIYELCSSGELDSIVLRGSKSRSRRILRSSLVEWVRKQPTKPHVA